MDDATRDRLFHGARNDRWLDVWSGVHLVTGVAMGWFMDPFIALVVMIAWEPFEILVLGPMLWRLRGVEFGQESWKNAMSDVFFDAAGVALGAYALRLWLEPPFVWP